MIRRPPRSPLFPYPPLSRSADERRDLLAVELPQLRDIPQQRGGQHWPHAGHAAQQVILLPPHGTLPERRSEEHTSELQSQSNLVCRLLLEKKKNKKQ